MSVFLRLALVSSTASAQVADGDRATLRHLKTIEWPKAYRERDTVLLKRILADEFQSIDESGEVSTRQNEIEYIKTHKPTYSSFTFTINRLDVFENNTAVVSGTGLVSGKGKEGAWEMSYQSSNVFIKRNGQWQAISSHVSGVRRK